MIPSSLSILFLVNLLQGVASSKSQNEALLHQVYLDVEPINTTSILEAIRAVNISTYRYAYERQLSLGDKPRRRIGALGSDLALLIPDAVEIVPKRILPPLEKGGSPITLHDVPVVNENTLFMYGLGATQELIHTIEELKQEISQQIDRVMDLYGETTKLENMISSSSYDHTLLKMRAVAAEAEVKRKEIELEIQKAKDDEEFVRVQNQAELTQIRRNDHLTLERLKKEDLMAKVRSKEDLRIKYESNHRLQMARSNAAVTLSKMEYERELTLQRATEELKTQTAQKIAAAKATAERANEDVRLRKLRAEAEQNRKRNIAAINAIASHIAQSFYSATKNPKQVFLFIWYITILASGIYTAREVARFCRVVIESTLGKPKLIRETSRKSLPYQYLTDVIVWLCNIWSPSLVDVENTRLNLEQIFADVALPKALKDRVLNLATAASRSKDNNAPYRHILFYGPPGTGKTMVARKLAKSLGLEYAMMSGGDVGPLGTDAVTQIHGLFHWSKFCRNGVLLFIDEAEAFLANRNTNNMSENARNALNALLYNTGTERKDFMMVLATNRAEDLDSAVLDRCDESLFFPLPDTHSREHLLRHYFNTYVKNIDHVCVAEGPWYNKVLYNIQRAWSGDEVFKVEIENNVMDKEQMERLVNQTSTFSGREIAKLMIALQGAAYAVEGGVLTSKLIDEIVLMKVADHRVKRLMFGIQEEQPSQQRRDEVSFGSPIRNDSLEEESVTDYTENTSQANHSQSDDVTGTRTIQSSSRTTCGDYEIDSRIQLEKNESVVDARRCGCLII